MPAIKVGSAFFNQGINMAGGAGELLNATITEVIEDHDYQDLDDYQKEMGFVKEIPLSPESKISMVAGPTGLFKRAEGQPKQELTVYKAPNKGFRTDNWAGKLSISNKVYNWARKARDLKGANNTMIAGLKKLATDTESLIDSTKITMQEQMTRVYTDGFTILDYAGPGSPTHFGKSLFSLTHPAMNGGLTFSNVHPTNAPLTRESLLYAISALKSTRGLNGRKIKGLTFTLVVGQELEATALQILNVDSTGRPMQYSGVGANANQANIFNVAGFRVNLSVNPYIGDYDSMGKLIGKSTMWFLRNDMFVKRGGLKVIELLPPEFDNWENKDTDTIINDVQMDYGFDHFGMEAGLFGSKGDGTTHVDIA